MTPADFELLEHLRDGTLDAAARDALAQRLNQDPTLRAEMARDLRLGNALHALVKGRDPVVAQRTQSLIDAELPASSQHTVAQVMAGIAPWWYQPRIWVAAASLAAVVTMALVWPSSAIVAWGDGLLTLEADTLNFRWYDSQEMSRSQRAIRIPDFIHESFQLSAAKQ